jgi:hypothetical protein
MLDLEHVHPRLRQRKAAVDSRRAKNMGANRLALISALKRAIDFLDREADATPQTHIGTTISLYRWALAELEASMQTQSAELECIYTICTLLDGASQDLMRKISIDHDNVMEIE